jgi:hypothetical protein
LSLSKRAIVTSVCFAGKTVNSLSKTLDDAETQTVLNFDGCEFEQVKKESFLIGTKKAGGSSEEEQQQTYDTVPTPSPRWISTNRSFGIHIVH